MIQTYNEFSVIFNDGEIIEKTPTKRKSVRIRERTAKTNNLYSKTTGLFYELEKQKPGRKPKDK